MDRHRLFTSESFTEGHPDEIAGQLSGTVLDAAYGGMARYRGGALSGKKPSRADRRTAYARHWVARNTVVAGLASRAEVQVACASGKPEPVGPLVETLDTETIPVATIQAAVSEVFDLRPAAIIRDLGQPRPIYAQSAVHGHFGRSTPDFTWERTDRAEQPTKALDQQFPRG
ncbi:methionine adenosyltransferase domain-containing protein [Kitasatospora purpeofusca]|uniref:methionine adenosyltransferase domain-containing protein n=1 Tax=Kitasatospora purpeofusca TaxID=67352 RepID=UPI0038602DEF